MASVFTPRNCRKTDLLSSSSRRRWIAGASSALLALASDGTRAAGGPDREAIRLVTLGDSVLDCARYNERGIDPGQLLVHNDDALFPEFRGRDLQARGPARLEHRAVDGATVDGLAAQTQGLTADRASIAILTIGGNDLLRGLADDTGPGLQRFEATLERFVRELPVRLIVLGTVYDPTFGDDSRNFLDVPARIARANLNRVNEIIGTLGMRFGRLADLHMHFLRGQPAWFTHTVEPSLTGASEVRRVFLASLQSI